MDKRKMDYLDRIVDCGKVRFEEEYKKTISSSHEVLFADDPKHDRLGFLVINKKNKSIWYRRKSLRWKVGVKNEKTL